MSKFGDFIRQRREDMGFSVRKLGEMSGLSYSYIAQLERGVDPRTGKTVYPTVQTLNKLGHGLGCSVDEMLPFLKESIGEDIDIEIGLFEKDLEKRMEGLEDNEETRKEIEFHSFVNENQDIIKLLIELKKIGYSSEIITEWIISLKNSLESIKRNYPRVTYLGENTAEQQEVVNKLQTKLQDPNYIPPWERNK